MSDVSGCELRSKIPPNATAKKFAMMTNMDARKREVWPWRSAIGAMSTGEIFVYLRPSKEAGDVFPL